MTDTNQKLREALRVAHDHIDMWSLEISHCKDAALIREALTLPTAAQVDDINVAESFTSVTKTAPPVVEREAFEDLIEEFEAAAIDKHDCRNPEYEFEHRAYDTACQRYDTARAALSAGDAGWQPIETAPKVGVLLLCLPVSGNCRAEDRRVYESRWNEDQQTWTSVNGFILLTDATHWMALPPAPAMRKGQL